MGTTLRSIAGLRLTPVARIGSDGKQTPGNRLSLMINSSA